MELLVVLVFAKGKRWSSGDDLPNGQNIDDAGVDVDVPCD
jgi:hypothetical protein